MLSLESKCKDFQVNIAALREEISERESVIAQNYTTIQLLRRRLADMEKHKFVLGYRTQVGPCKLHNQGQDAITACCCSSLLQATSQHAFDMRGHERTEANAEISVSFLLTPPMPSHPLPCNLPTTPCAMSLPCVPTSPGVAVLSRAS